MTSSTSPPSRGDLLLHPVALLALGGLLLNDHVLKAASADTPFTVVTGKLSDVCGVLFLPILVVAAVEFAGAVVKGRVASVEVAGVVAVVVGVAFALMKTVPACGDVYAWALGALQWPVRALVAVLNGSVNEHGLPSWQPVVHVVDPTDVVAVPFAFVVVALQRRRARQLRSALTNA